ncbi:unnamed protein product, partial [marine sediment metagenome]
MDPVSTLIMSILSATVYDAFKSFFQRTIPKSKTSSHLEMRDKNKLRFKKMDDYHDGISSLIFVYDRICQLEGQFKILVGELGSKINIKSLEIARMEIEKMAKDVADASKGLETHDNIKEMIWRGLSWTHRRWLLDHLEEGKYKDRYIKLESIFIGLEPPENVVMAGDKLKINIIYVLNFARELERLRQNIRRALE